MKNIKSNQNLNYNIKLTILLIWIMPIMNVWAITNKRYELLSGIKKVKDKQTFWNKAYGRKKYIYGKAPAKFLAKNLSYFKPKSKILDMGMGEGRNSVFLAQNKFIVTGVDISKIAIRKANLLSRERNVKIKTIVASLNKYKFKKNSFDAIIIFYYVDRSLNQKIYDWLKPGGILMYESYTRSQKKITGFENQKDQYLLGEGELLKMFPQMRTLKFEEPINVKNFTSSIILMK